MAIPENLPASSLVGCDRRFGSTEHRRAALEERLEFWGRELGGFPRAAQAAFAFSPTAGLGPRGGADSTGARDSLARCRNLAGDPGPAERPPVDAPLYWAMPEYLPYLTEEHHQVREMAREFAEAEIRPIARELDAAQRFPWENVKKMAELGFLGAPWDPELGGAGMAGRVRAHRSKCGFGRRRNGHRR